MGIVAKNLNISGIREFTPVAPVTWANPNETKVFASDGADWDKFSESVAISDDSNTVLIGAREADAVGTSSGAVYVYRWNGTGWDETKLLSSDLAAFDYFGYAVAISGDGNTLLIGAYGHDALAADAGAAYIYRWNGTTWAETKLLASDGAANDLFGYALSLSGDANTAVIGATGRDDWTTNVGAVYVYRWNGTSWAETKMLASDSAQNDSYGHAVSVSDDGNTLVVGVPFRDTSATDGGAVYVYRWNGTAWDETKIVLATSAYQDEFGTSVAMAGDGNTFVVGCPKRDTLAANAGAVYVYRWNGTAWDETQILASDGAADDVFAHYVSISADGNTFIAGAVGDDDLGSISGSAYIYRWNGTSWNETKLLASDGAANDRFGLRTAMTGDGNSAVIGALRAAGVAAGTGAAYVYRTG